MLAAAGSSIGLGNIWKFPYETGLHGGGTFLLVYIPCALLVAFPLMMAEVLIGRYGRGNPIHGIRHIAKQEHLSSLWPVIGWFGLISSFLIFSFYSVVASWILFYIMQSAMGSFVGVPAEIVQHSYGALLRNSDQMMLWHTIFVLMVVVVLTRGVRGGLERALRIIMPCFIALLIWLCVYASQVGDFDQALHFLASYDLAAIDAELVVSAMAQALFSLSVGIGALVMFGAYMRDERSIASAASWVMVFDTVFALLMALMIFSIVFAFGMDADSGAGLIFETLPVAFSQMTEYSVVWSTLFFTLLLAASLTSAFALLEPIIAALTQGMNISRRLAAWLVGACAWAGGMLTVYSFNELKFSFYYFGEQQSNGVFDVLNIVATHVMMPLGALLIALFAGWRIHHGETKSLLAMRVEVAYRLWRFCTRILAPIVLGAVLVMVLFFPA